MRLAAASCPGLDPCQPVLLQEEAQGGGPERAGLGMALHAGGWAHPSVENTFPKPPGPGGCSGLVITGLSFKNMLQTWLRAGGGNWTSRPSVAEWAAQERTRSREPWRGRLSCGLPGGLPSRPPWLPLQLGRQRLAACGPRLLGQVETSPFKPARANQGLARPPVQTRLGPAPAGPPAPASETPAARGGAGEPAASVTAEQHRRLRLPAVPPGLGPRPWSTPCTASPWGAGARSPACLSTSAPLVSAARAAAPCAQRPERALVVIGDR